MLPTSFYSITGKDLCELVSNEARESRRVDFKRDLYKLDAPDAKTRSEEMRELISDVVAFANSEGGDLIIGITETDEVATASEGIDLKEATDFDRKLANYWMTKVEPPLSAVVDSRVIPHPFHDNKAFIVVRIRPSQNAPHRTTAERLFFERSGAQKNPMDMSRIREAFLREDIHFDAFNRFRHDRQQRVLGENAHPHPLIQIHVAPLHALARSSRQLLDFAALDPRKTMPNLGRVDREFFTATGFFRTEFSDEQSGPRGFHVFFDGKYEQVIGGAIHPRMNGTRVLPLRWLMLSIAITLKHARRIATQIGNGPTLIGVTASNLGGSILDLGKNYLSRESNVAPGEIVFCPELRLELLPESSLDFAKEIAPSLLPIFLAYNRDKVELSLSKNDWELIDKEIDA